jgi:hypothetical protein
MGLSASSAISISGPLIPSILGKSNNNNGLGGPNDVSGFPSSRNPQDVQDPDDFFGNLEFLSLNPGSPTSLGAGFSDDIFLNPFFGPEGNSFAQFNVRITNLAFGGSGSGSGSNNNNDQNSGLSSINQGNGLDIMF